MTLRITRRPARIDGVEVGDGAMAVSQALRLKGADGRTAYEVAVAAGFSGDQAAWLASLHGADGREVQLRVNGGYIQWRLDAGTWANLVPLADLEGERGPAGYYGWSPVFAVVEDGTRRVIQLVDWQGGTGAKPEAGLFVGEGGLVATANLAADVRGGVGPAGPGTGDVNGPASSVNGRLAAFDGTDGKLLKDSGLAVDTDGALAANADTKLATQKAVKTYVDSGLAAKASTSYVDGKTDALARSMRWLELQTAIAMVAMPDGYADSYGDSTGINAGASSNYRLLAGDLRPVVISGAGTNVATSGQAISGGYSGSDTANKAFDNNTNTAWTSSQTGAAANGVAWIGQDFGGTPRSIRRVTLRNNPYNTNTSVTSVKIEYSDDGSSWTTATTANSLSTTVDATNTIDVPESGAHRYWRALANASPSSGQPWVVIECTMLLGVPANMTVVETAQASQIGVPSKANVLLLLAPAELSTAPTINTDMIVSVSRNGGSAYTAVTLSLSATLPDGTKLYEGSATFGGASGSSMVLKMVSANAKDARIAAVAFQWSV